MAITLTGTGGLFTRLGRFGKVAHETRDYQTGLASAFSSLMGQYDGLRVAVDGVPTLDEQTRLAAGRSVSSLVRNAQRTVLDMVKADKPSFAGSLADALAELITQMDAGSETVKSCTVSASTAALSTNSAANGVVVVTTKRGDGLVQELAFPESSRIECTVDSQTGGATSGQETFTYTGEVAASSVWSDEYPIGSGAVTSFEAIDATEDGTSSTEFGNLLRNSDFESVTSNKPDYWEAVTGTAGTHFDDSTTAFSGTKSLQFIGSATNTCLAQTFNSSSYTPAVPLPRTSYAVSFWVKVDVVPAAGVLTVELVDGSNTVVNDDQGVANSFTVALTGVTTSWANRNGVFRLPKLVPSVLKIRLRLSTALSVGSNLFVDHLAMGRVTGLYAGGVGCAVFSGSERFATGDGWAITTTNDFGGSTNLSTFQWLFDRLFGMRDLGLLLPTDASPSIADTLITS